MSSQSPDSFSAFDFDKNTVGRYGIQPYRFEPRVETVSTVDEARSSSGEDDDMDIEEEERNPRLQNSDW